MSSKTKKIVVDSSDDDEDQTELPPVMTAPAPKTKKERSPAQKEAFSKAMSILKEKRESKANEDKERIAKASQEEKEAMAKEKYEKAKNHKKKLPPAPSYVTMSDMEKFKMDILNAVREPVRREPKEEDLVKKPVIAREPDSVLVPIKEPVAAPVIIPMVKERKKELTGHDLLDKLFFS